MDREVPPAQSRTGRQPLVSREPALAWQAQREQAANLLGRCKNMAEAGPRKRRAAEPPELCLLRFSAAPGAQGPTWNPRRLTAWRAWSKGGIKDALEGARL